MAIEPLPEHTVDPRRVGDSVELLRRRFGLAPSNALEEIRGGWEGLVGPAVAGRSEAIDLRDGTLRVRVDDSAVAERLRWDEARILAEASRSATVRGLSIRVSPARGDR